MILALPEPLTDQHPPVTRRLLPRTSDTLSAIAASRLAADQLAAQSHES